MRKALISVTDKSCLAELGSCLKKHGIEMISTGGTAKKLKELGHEVVPIENITGNPECFDGRVKTLSFQIESGILFKRNDSKHIKEAKENSISPIDFVIVNLYPFEQAAKDHPNDLDQLIANIDIGGPTLLRSAAKNFESVTVLNSPDQYASFINEMNNNQGETSLDFRKKCALNVFRKTQNYDQHIARALSTCLDNGKLRYGENPHQESIVYPTSETGILSGKQIQGKEFSYNNYLDMTQAWELISELNQRIPEKVCTAVIKHGGPCGVAAASTSEKALKLAWQGDATSAFGSIVASNKTINKEEAEFLTLKFVEIVMAPSFSNEALQLFSKKKNLRVYQIEPLTKMDQYWEERTIPGGKLIQRKDSFISSTFETVTKENFSKDHMELIPFGIITTKYLKSNAIGIASMTWEGDYWMSGSGAGQPNRLDSFHLAAKKFYTLSHDQKHTEDFKANILVSDAFFPFDDIVKLCTEIDVHHIVQPGGSIRDEEVIKTCNDLNLAMVKTGIRHFKH